MSGLHMHAADLDSQSTTHLRPFKSSKIPAKGVNEKVFDIPSSLASSVASYSLSLAQDPCVRNVFFFPLNLRRKVYFHAAHLFKSTLI